jgi:membrane protease YdiL (CAAX protease family)
VEAYAETAAAPSATPPVWGTPTWGPDNPPWSATAGVLIWIASLLLLLFVPTLAGAGYILTRIRSVPADKLRELLVGDPTFILISVAAVIPAHLLTLWLVWWLVTARGRRSLRDMLGLSWSRRLGPLEIFAWLGVVGLLFVTNALIVRFFPGSDTDLERIIASSLAARYIIVALATFTAPVVEETVYRGVLYPALRRAVGLWPAVFIVAGLFAGVHAYQYRQNVGVILAISLLSLTLTLVRAQTGRLLPCIIIHLLFNGLTSAAILYEAHTRGATPTPAPTPPGQVWPFLHALGRAAGLSF